MTSRASLVLVLALAACGRIHQHSERWVAVGQAADDPRVHFGLEPTRTDSPGGLFGDREIREVAPYTAWITAFGDASVEQPLRVHELRFLAGDEGKEIVVLREEDPPFEAALALGSGTHPWTARIAVPLGDRIVFGDGEHVTFDARVTLPWDTDSIGLVRTFRGDVTDASGAKIDALVGQ